MVVFFSGVYALLILLILLLIILLRFPFTDNNVENGFLCIVFAIVNIHAFLKDMIGAPLPHKYQYPMNYKNKPGFTGLHGRQLGITCAIAFPD